MIKIWSTNIVPYEMACIKWVDNNDKFLKNNLLETKLYVNKIQKLKFYGFMSL